MRVTLHGSVCPFVHRRVTSAKSRSETRPSVRLPKVISCYWKWSRGRSPSPTSARCAKRTVGEASIAICAMVGWALVFVGFLCGLVATIGHLAWALPLSELLSRPSMLPGLLYKLAGGMLIGAPRIHRFRKRGASQGATVAQLHDDGIAAPVREVREGGSRPPSRQGD